MKKLLFALIVIVLLVLSLVGYRWVWYVRQSHLTFENYYAFRGCAELLERTDQYGVCKLKSGQTIKLVKYQNKWYLDGDLPVCQFGICF